MTTVGQPKDVHLWVTAEQLNLQGQFSLAEIEWQKRCRDELRGAPSWREGWVRRLAAQPVVEVDELARVYQVSSVRHILLGGTHLQAAGEATSTYATGPGNIAEEGPHRYRWPTLKGIERWR